MALLTFACIGWAGFCPRFLIPDNGSAMACTYTRCGRIWSAWACQAIPWGGACFNRARSIVMLISQLVIDPKMLIPTVLDGVGSTDTEPGTRLTGLVVYLPEGLA